MVWRIGWAAHMAIKCVSLNLYLGKGYDDGVREWKAQHALFCKCDIPAYAWVPGSDS